MIYLTQTLFVPWLIAALLLGAIVGWKSTRRTPPNPGLGWLGVGLPLFVVALFIAGTVAIPGRAGLWFDTALHFLFWYVVGCCIGTLMARLGIRDGTVEPVPAWVKPVRTEGAVAEPPKPSMAEWIKVKPQAGAVAAGSVPALQAAREWVDVLFGRGMAEKPAVPDWVRPILPAAGPDAASASRASPPWQAARTDAGVTLTGEVPSEASRARMLDEARKTLSPLTITDRLAIGAASEGIEKMASTAFGHLARLDRGIASVVDGRYTLTGVARQAQDRPALIAAAAALPAGFTLDRVDIAEPTLQSGASAGTFDGERPKGLEGPREGKADDLKRIRGIGPQNEGRLHGLGIWHFDQIAAWTADNALWVGSYLAFPGRIEREDWVGQAKKLASGQDTEFSKRVDKGLVATSRDNGALGKNNIETVAPGGTRAGTPPAQTGKKPKA